MLTNKQTINSSFLGANILSWKTYTSADNITNGDEDEITSRCG